VAVVATLSKGYDLDYIWKQVDRGPAKDAAGYYIQASESGGEPPGRWWGPGARALGLKPGQRVERKPYDLLFAGLKWPHPPTRWVAFLECHLPRLLPDRWRRAAGQGGAPALRSEDVRP
jgi:TrwC relaxase